MPNFHLGWPKVKNEKGKKIFSALSALMIMMDVEEAQTKTSKYATKCTVSIFFREMFAFTECTTK